MAARPCGSCCGSGLVCEDHPYRPWVGVDDELCCAAAGMYCPECTPPGRAATRPGTPSPRPRPPVINGLVAHLGGPLDGWPSTAPLGPDDRPPRQLPYPAGGGTYLRTSGSEVDPTGATRTVYLWQPAPDGRRSPNDCSCGLAGCPNATRRQPP